MDQYRQLRHRLDRLVQTMPIRHEMDFRTCKSDGRFCANPCLHFDTTDKKLAKMSPEKCGQAGEKSLLQKYFSASTASMNI
jgi:hypothetical protein